MKEFIVSPHNEDTIQVFIKEFESQLKDGDSLKITMKAFSESSLPQKALAHIWIREYAAFYHGKTIKELTKKEEDNMKVTLKQRAYKEYGWDFLLKEVTNVETGRSAHILESISEYDKGECYIFMEFMQDYCADQGLVLKSTGEYKKLKDETMQ